MEILTSLAAEIAEYAVAPIGRQMGYMFSYTNNFLKLTDQLGELDDTKGTIERRVNFERRNGKEIKEDVLKWSAKVDKITEEAKQLCDHPYREKVGCSKWSFPNLWQRHQLSRKAKKVADNVAVVLGERKKLETDEIGFRPPISGVGSTSAASRFVDFESRRSKMNEIMQALTDPNLSILGVYGFGGVGKTTLVDQIARKAKNDNLFGEVVRASATKSLDLRRIQGEIADQLDLQFTEETVAGRAYRLHDIIKKREKNILIILDDIWEAMKLEEIGIPYRGKIYPANREMESQGDRMGCKVLLISRNQFVLQQMGTHIDFRLDVLSEQETWRLFGFMAGDVAKDASYQDIAIKVAKKCAGLPVLIVTVARALQRKGIAIWEDALSQLERVENRELQEITYSALELSYNQLESNEVKALFLLCGVEGPCIAVEDILKYVMGLGVLEHNNSLKDARNRLHNLISALEASCLLLEDTDAELLRMHDIVHEVAISIASRDEHIFISKRGSEFKWPAEDLLRRCPQIILRNCSLPELPERLDCPELKFLHLDSASNRSLGIRDSFFEGMGKLQVLDITCMNISSLPTSLSSLTSLQTLCLRECSLGDVTGIGALKNLKILNLAKSSMEEMPSEIVKLTNLRMLDLSSSGIAVIPPNIISSLTTLEELYMGDASIKWEFGNSAKQSKNASLAELRQLPNLSALDVQIQDVQILPRDLVFDKLESFKILIGDVWEWTGNDGTSKTLKIKLPRTSIHFEHGIKALTKAVESLWMDEVDGISNVLYQLNGEGFPQLKHLHIQNNAKIQHIINSLEWNPTPAYDSFPNLETLVLQNLNYLEKICHGPLRVNSLSKLRVIKVKSCHQLEYLFSFSMIERLPQLLDIEVSECNSMNKIVLVESDNVLDNSATVVEFGKLQHLTLQQLPRVGEFCANELISYDPMLLFGSKAAFPKLETLKLNSISLGKIWDDAQLSATCGIQNLTSLIVKNCSNLEYLFSCKMVGSLSNLKQLEISECHMMEEIINTKEEGRNNCIVAPEVIRFAKLEKIMIEDMEKLKAVWHHQFDQVKTVKVKKCDKLVCIFPSSMQTNFLCLKTLTVSDCNSMKEIFKLSANEAGCGVDKTELEKLSLIDLPNLLQIWSMEPEGILSFYNLQVVNVESCVKLKYLFPLSVATGLHKINGLSVIYCNYMTEVVANNGGHIKGSVRFDLNQLTTLELWSLTRLRGFYAENHTLNCPSLKNIYVEGCCELVLFKMQSKSFQERDGAGKLHVSLQQPLFIVEEVIPHLEILTVDSTNASKIVQGGFSPQLISKLKELWVSKFEDEQANFPYWFLQNVPNLESLTIRDSSFKKIFQDERSVIDNRQSGRRTKLKELWLVRLPELRYICKEGSQVDPALEVLEKLYIIDCSNLMNLLPPSLTFSSLEVLEVEKCNGLLNLITFTIAKSLVKLKSMKIKNCNALEEIMKEEECETYEDIAFGNLEILELRGLPQLKRFCSSHFLIKFPLLSRVVVSQCPRMRMFSEKDTSTPKLRKARVEEENNVEWFWESNLNGTIKNMFSKKKSYVVKTRRVVGRQVSLVMESSCDTMASNGDLHCGRHKRTRSV